MLKDLHYLTSRHYKETDIKTAVLAYGQTDLRNRIESPEKDPNLYGQLIFDKGAMPKLFIKKGNSFQEMMQDTE